MNLIMHTEDPSPSRMSIKQLDSEKENNFRPRG
jgi:hypothetical protein